MDLPPSVHDPAVVRELADTILAGHQYRRPPKSIPDRILEWFGDQLGKILGSLVGSGGGTVIAWGFVAAAIAVVVLLIVRYGGGPRARVPRAPRPTVMVELTRTPGEWRAEAEMLEGRGRWREGLRCRHRALIGELVRCGAISDQAGRTSGEYVRDVAAVLPDAERVLAEATKLFEDAWYGDLPTGSEESARFQVLATDVLAAAVAVDDRSRSMVTG